MLLQSAHIVHSMHTLAFHVCSNNFNVGENFTIVEIIILLSRVSVPGTSTIAVDARGFVDSSSKALLLFGLCTASEEPLLIVLVYASLNCQTTSLPLPLRYGETKLI